MDLACKGPLSARLITGVGLSFFLNPCTRRSFFISFTYVRGSSTRVLPLPRAVLGPRVQRRREGPCLGRAGRDGAAGRPVLHEAGAARGWLGASNAAQMMYPAGPAHV